LLFSSRPALDVTLTFQTQRRCTGLIAAITGLLATLLRYAAGHGTRAAAQLDGPGAVDVGYASCSTCRSRRSVMPSCRATCALLAPFRVMIVVKSHLMLDGFRPS
jgi:hypothetical protein